ncbi:unnamed protein product [Cylindrotheca closterium]|uniref:Ionotropic glutamate receptor C-terminal domain-containing protein n=1 Tax=Cylindrotheca closterium TaxID=2856 RepID=A0AAD2JH12_9STRA|nr:unnamed protein product [Cylindrotheca closterium]
MIGETNYHSGKMIASVFRVASSLLLLSCILQSPSSVDGYIDWETVPEGIFVGPGVGQIQETDFCDVVRDNSMPLLDALKGRNLSIAIQYGPGFDFFIYKPDEPLSPSNPRGMIATMLDELGRRGGFSWRNSFVAYDTNTVNALVGEGDGKWDRMLNWTISTFDLSVDKWILTTERLENETVFLHSWFDAGLILVDQGDQTDLNWLGFAAPFDGYVWMAIAFTLFFSAVSSMVIESFEGRRGGRSYAWWLGDQLYFSNLAISQHFVFPSPKTGAGRVFLSSFAFWSMLVGATYTANLASLLVENALASPVNSIESAMDNDLWICIHEGSASQSIMHSLIPESITYDKFIGTLTPQLMYENLQSGGCDILLGTRQEYEIFGSQQQYGCNLVQAGMELHSSAASFAIEFDPLNCDSVLAYVLNIHLNSIDVDGNMTKYWKNYLDNIEEDTCTDEQDQLMGIRRRMVEMDGKDTSAGTASKLPTSRPPRPPPANLKNRRKLISRVPSATSAVSGNGSGNDEALTISGMAGIFLIHAVGTGLSILLAIYSAYRRKRKRKAAAALGKGKRFDDNSFVESELNLKYLSMKREMTTQMQNMKLDMMTQMDNFFELHRKSVSNGTADLGMEQQRQLTNSREVRTSRDTGQISKTVHSNSSMDTGDVYDDWNDLHDL